jgi:hypothetical protein
MKNLLLLLIYLVICCLSLAVLMRVVWSKLWNIHLQRGPCDEGSKRTHQYGTASIIPSVTIQNLEAFGNIRIVSCSRIEWRIIHYLAL